MTPPSPAELIALRALLGRAPAEGVRFELKTGSVILLPAKPAEESAQPEEENHVER